MSYIIYNSKFIENFQPISHRKFIENLIDEDKLSRLNLIVPTGRLQRYYKRELTRKYFRRHKKPLSKLNIHTLQTFVQSCYSNIPQNKKQRFISDAYRLALTEEACEKSEMVFFKKDGRKPSPSVLKKLNDVIYGLREDGISGLDLLAETEKISASDAAVDLPRMRDIAILCSSYEELLSNGLLDYPAMMQETNSLLAQNISGELFPSSGINLQEEILNGSDIVLFLGFSDFHLPEIEFISNISLSDISLCIFIEYSEYIGPLFSNLERIILSFKESGLSYSPLDENNEKRLADTENIEKLSRSDYLRRWLFNTEKEIKNSNFDGIVKIIGAQDKIDEVRSIAKLVRYEIIRNKLHPSDICISARQPELYSGLFREVLAQYRIPANITDRFALSRSPAAIALFAVLSLISNGYRKEDVQKVLLSSYLNFNRLYSKLNDKIDAANLIEAANKLRIIGGYRHAGAWGWKKRLESVMDSIRYKIDALSKQSSDKFETEDLKRLQKKLYKALNDFKIIEKSIKLENKKYLPEEFRKVLLENLEELGVLEHILSQHEEVLQKSTNSSGFEKNMLLENIEKDTRAYTSLIECITETTEILEERFPKQRFELSELIRRLKTAASGTKYQIREKMNHGVTVTSIEQTRGIPYKLMILCGAADKEFPLSYRPETFLGKELHETEERHNKNEKMQFYQFLVNGKELFDNGNKQTVITYPMFENGEEIVRSPFIDALSKVTTLSSSHRIYNLTEIRNRIGDDKNQDELINKQLQDIPWLVSVASDNEVYRILSAKSRLKITELQTEHLLRSEEYRKFNDYFQKVSDELITDKAGMIRVNNTEDPAGSIMSKFSDKVWSVTELETYSSCPFKYYLKYVLNIKEPREEDLTLSPLERGNLFHKILYKFYSELQSESKEQNPGYFKPTQHIEFFRPVVLETEKKERYHEILLAIAREEIESVRYEHPFFGIEEKTILGRENHPGILSLWLTSELQIQTETWNYYPAYFELAFGTDTAENSIPAVELSSELKLKGKIDRIEFLEQEEAIRYLIADYKLSSGSFANLKKINKGISFQIPLYALAAKKLFEESFGENLKFGGAAYYSVTSEYDIKKNKFKLPSILLSTKESNVCTASVRNLLTDEGQEAVLENSLLLAEKVIQDINSGKFPIAPSEAMTCRYCTFYAVCRINEKNTEGEDISD